MASTKVQRIMTQPINLIFRFLQSKARIQIWLFEQKDLRIEGRIIGFDEYMNLVLDDAEEVNIKKKSSKSLGRILLKGDNITLMMNWSIHYYLLWYLLIIPSSFMYYKSPYRRCFLYFRQLMVLA
ncbi:hypothetical protein DITRI_Ditri07aG0018700 [Diplodiscus trichospermus]